MIFEMSEQQQRKLYEWQDAIEKVYGKRGSYEYTFRPNGIDYTVTVYSDLADFELDLTEIKKF